MKITLNQTGSVLLSIVIMFPFLILITALYLELSVSSLKIARTDQSNTHAQFAADAGVDFAMQQINASTSWVGTTGETELSNDGLTKTTYQVTVTDIDSTNKEVLAVGRTYRPASASTANSTVKLKVDLRAVSSGLYSIVTGVGGLIMTNSAKVLGGDVKVNGEITMSNTAQIGLSTSPVTVEVAHQNCPNPADATYPQLCGSSAGQPITINNSAHIYGSIRANNQTTTTGFSDPGLVASSGVTPSTLPTHDRDAQKAAVGTTITGAAAGCSGSQTRTWAANTKITGDVTIRNSCVVTVLGDVWITGKLELENTSRMIVSDALGTTRPNIMIDSSNGARFKNSTILQSNSSSTGFQILSYYSRASCSPDCTDVTGTDLYNSRNDVTIELDNSSQGPNTIFYARWSRVQLGNSGQIGALVGQTVELKNTATITFGTSVGTGSTYWVIDGYRRSFD
jgi:hypothetical protein